MTSPRISIVKNIAMKSIILGVYVGAWAGLFVTGSEWVFVPALVSVPVAAIVGLIIWVVLKESNKAIWIGFIVATLFLIISSCIGGLQLINYAGSTGAGFTAVAIGFEMIGAFIGATLFLILGVIIGLISAFRSIKT